MGFSRARGWRRQNNHRRAHVTGADSVAGGGAATMGAGGGIGVTGGGAVADGSGAERASGHRLGPASRSAPSILRVLRARVELDDVVVDQERLLVIAGQPERLRGVEQDGRILLQLERLLVLDCGVVIFADGEVRGRLLVVGSASSAARAIADASRRRVARNPDNPTRPRARRALRRKGISKKAMPETIRKRMG